MAELKATGNVGADSDLRFTPGGDAVLNFSIADSKSRKLENGEWETTATQWLRVTVWRELAEFYADKVLKGTRLTVYGDFMAREYDKDGVTRTSLDVTAKGIEIHPKRGDQQSTRQQPAQAAQNASQGWGQQQPTADPWGAPQDDSAPF